MELHSIILLSSILPMIYLQYIIHELSHGIPLKTIWGWGIKLHFLPSRKSGKFMLVRCTFSVKSDALIVTNNGKALVSFMPKIINIILIIFITCLSIIVSFNKLAAELLLMFSFVNYVDFTLGLLYTFKSKPSKNDMWSVQKSLSIPSKYMRIAAASLILFIGFVVFTGAYTIF